jgi:hypothetical protein
MRVSPEVQSSSSLLKNDANAGHIADFKICRENGFPSAGRQFSLPRP